MPGKSDNQKSTWTATPLLGTRSYKVYFPLEGPALYNRGMAAKESYPCAVMAFCRVIPLISFFLPLGCNGSIQPTSGLAMQSAHSQPKSPADVTPNGTVALAPTDGLVKDGIYTNSFFQFSIEFPRAWKILDTGTPIKRNNTGPAAGLIPHAENSVEAGYSLFWAGTVDKQTQNLHGVMICAFKPTASAPNATPEKFVRAEANAIKVVAAEYLKNGQTPALAAGEPTESHISGRRVARLDETGEMNQKPAKFVHLVTDERGYLILFIFFDSTEDVANYQASKEITSLRFFGRKN
jgi:hypothetical protein